MNEHPEILKGTEPSDRLIILGLSSASPFFAASLAREDIHFAYDGGGAFSFKKTPDKESRILAAWAAARAEFQSKIPKIG